LIEFSRKTVQKMGLSWGRFRWRAGTPSKNLWRLADELGARETASAWWLL